MLQLPENPWRRLCQSKKCSRCNNRWSDGITESYGSRKGGKKCALDEIKDLYGFDTAAIVSMADVVECLYNKECNGKVVIDDTLKAAIDAYYEQYGAK